MTPAAAGCVPCSTLDASHLLTLPTVQQRVASKLPLWTVTAIPNSTPPLSDPSASADNDEDVDAATSSVGHCLRREFVARNFQAALDALNAMGAIAETHNHHPDFFLTNYRTLTLVLYTHKLGGLTENDFQLATLLDQEVAVDYSPKWLKAHPEAQATQKQQK